MPGSAARLYDEDFVRWTEEQAAALRNVATASNLPLDWQNLAEEIDSLGRSQRNELASRLATILEHLIKLENSPALDPRPSWMDTVDRERAAIDRLLHQSPSLRGEVGAMISAEAPRAVRLAIRSLERHGETAAAEALRRTGANRSEEQVLDDWFPPDPATRGDRGQGD